MAHPNVSDRVESVGVAEEQVALRRVATLVAQGASPAEVFEAVVTEIGRQIPGANAAALSRYETDDMLTMIGKWSRSGGYVPVGARYPLVSGTVGSLIAESRQPGRVDVDKEGFRSLPEVVRDLGWRSVVGAPIIVEGRLWGLVGISSTTERSLPPDAEARLAEFTELVATAIANAESREALTQLADEQAALRRVATLVAQDARPSEIFTAVAEEVAGLFQTMGSVLRFEEDGQANVIVGIANVDIPVGTRLPLEEGMGPLEVYRTGRSVRIDHTKVDHSKWSTDKGSVVATAGHLGLVSSVVGPIVVEGRTWGVIGVSSTDDPLPIGTEERLEKFTDLVASAIANAQSREALAELAGEQAALRRVATLVAAQAAPLEIYAAVAEEVARLLRADRGAIVHYEPDAPLTVTAYWSTDGTDVPVGTRIPAQDDVVTATVRQAGGPIRIETYDDLSGPLVNYARSIGTLPPSTVAAPIFVEGRDWGVIFVSAMKAEPFPADAESRVMLFTELVATAIANAENRSELAASRRRIVTASDEARRRIERDLHDGTQQRLVSLALAARAAEAELPTESGDVW